MECTQFSTERYEDDDEHQRIIVASRQQQQQQQKSKKQLLACIKSIIRLYNQRSLRIATVTGDKEFDCLQTDLEEKYNIDYNTAAKDEHVAEVECMIRVVKECI